MIKTTIEMGITTRKTSLGGIYPSNRNGCWTEGEILDRLVEESKKMGEMKVYKYIVREGEVVGETSFARRGTYDSIVTKQVKTYLDIYWQ